MSYQWKIIKIGPIGASSVPKANAVNHNAQNGGCSGGQGQSWGHGASWRLGNYNVLKNKNATLNIKKNNNGKQAQNKNVCHCCGMSNDWAKNYWTIKYFVDLYQQSKIKDFTSIEANYIDDPSKETKDLDQHNVNFSLMILRTILMTIN